MARRPYYAIMVGGADASSRFRPILISLSVSLQSGGTSDSASIVVDDSNGRVAIPPDDAPISILLGWEGGSISEVFTGKVNDVRSNLDRSGGMTLSIGATGLDTKGKAKEPRDKHYDDKTIGEIMEDAAKFAGKQIRVAPEIAQIKVPYLAQINESFVHLGHRLSRMTGGTFKVMGDRAVMVKRNAGQSATGKPLVPVIVSRGANLLSSDIKPYLGRPRVTKVRAKWYDRDKAEWKETEKPTQDTDAIAEGRIRYAAGSEAEANAAAESEAAESDRNKGEGTVEITGEPLAQPEAPCIVTGIRAGVDGSYIVDQVTHSLDRSGGFNTSLTLKRPKI